MKLAKIKNKIVAATLLAALCGSALAVAAPKTNLARADVGPKVIEITAKKFEFTPSEITLKKGQPVILRLTTADRVHGFMSKPLKFDTDIAVGKPTDVAITPDTTGDYSVICDHYCGTGHGGMKMKVTVVE
jgi:cytochrome c oxidase subunit II